MRTPLARTVLALAAGAAACREPVGARPATFQIEPTAQWSGGWVQVHSVALAAADTVVVTVAGDTTPLEARRLADTTLAVRLPPGVSGSVRLRAQLDGRPFLLDPIGVYGFTVSWEFPVVMDGDILVWPRDGHANVLGGTVDGVTLLQVDAGQVRLFPGTGRYGFLDVRGPGMTYRDGVFALAQVVGAPAELWRLLPSAEPIAVDSAVRIYRQAMQLNPRAWVVGGAHAITMLTWSDSLGRYESTDIRAEETEGMYMSPRGDRATVRVDWVFDGAGVPVFDAPAGVVAYRVPGMRRVAGADFSADGEWLALVGGESTHRLVLLRAATGEVVRDTVLDRPPFTVTLDAFAPLLYVGVSEHISPPPGYSHPVVLVFERDSGRLLAELRVPPWAPACFFDGCYKAVIARSAEPALYVVWAFQGQPMVWQFAMMPSVVP